jgi:hypothetical protein
MVRQIDNPIPIPRASVVKNASKIRLALLINPSTGVLNSNQNVIRFTHLGSDDQNAFSIRNRTHRFNRIHDEVEHYLLQLGPRGNYCWDLVASLLSSNT